MRSARESSDSSTADQLAVMKAQAKAMQGQIAAVRDAQRAWLKITSVENISVSSVFDGRMVWFWLRVLYKNMGQTPAHIKMLTPHVFVEGAPSPLPQLACKSDSPHVEGAADAIVFPQDNGEENVGVQVLVSDLMAQADHLHRASKDAPAYLELIGCLFYDFAGSDVPHVSGFIGDLLLKPVDGSTRKAALTADLIVPGLKSAWTSSCTLPTLLQTKLAPTMRSVRANPSAPTARTHELHFNFPGGPGAASVCRSPVVAGAT